MNYYLYNKRNKEEAIQLQQWLSQIGNLSSKNTNYYYFTNPDNSVRWIWPAKNNSPVFLRFFAVSGLKSKLFVAACKLVYLLKIQKVFFSKTSGPEVVFPLQMQLNPASDWALFTGTVGPNRKVILSAETTESVTSFIKIASSKNANHLLQNERISLNRISDIEPTCFEVPKVLNNTERWVQFSDITAGNRTQKFTQMHKNALLEVHRNTLNVAQLQDTQFYKKAIANYNQLNALNNAKLPKAIQRKLQWLIASVSKQASIETSTAHGDFTPWNCFVNKRKLGVYDWELAQENMPIGFDALHFIIQKGILVERKNWRQIESEITRELTPTIFENDATRTKNYLKLYLLHTVSYYLTVYGRQTDWHTQINWLFNAWNEALSSVLADEYSHRKLLLMDVFDYLQNKPYATLKFKEYVPEKLSENSDVDMCMSKHQAGELALFVNNHCLVQNCKMKSLSFMKNVRIVLKNNELLSLDALWQLKRRSLVFQDVEDVISHAIPNLFGIKQASALDEAAFVNHFYILNSATVPSAYKSHQLAVSLATQAQSENEIDKRKALINRLKQLPNNRAIKRVKNVLNYALDTIRNFVNQRGFIVTFSGVDGAGKSTLIEITKTRIEKQLRMPVVVIRHRPSVLPIISALTLGKEAAEQKAASTLPRQGKNNNLFSSLARFAYYYTDYLFGQFYIQFKYVLRGKVVLYDRYYFDFINDSKRSNISLPRWITKMGYALILKPDVNFFLYADAEVILARKQELDAGTISKLTQMYLDLFDALNQKKKVKKYHSINNIYLDETLKTIMQTLKKQAA